MYHNQTRFERRYVDLTHSINDIENKLIETTKAKFYVDKDEELRTIKGKFMSKKDISRIYNLYFNIGMGWKRIS